MRPSLDTLLSRDPGSPSPQALERALDSARQELSTSPRAANWRMQALGAVGICVGLVLAVAAVLLAAGPSSVGLMLGRAPLLGLLLLTCALCAWSALMPRGRSLRRWSLSLTWVTAAALVLTRATPPEASELPGWVCTASHVAAAVGPLAWMLIALRGTVFAPRRALIAGLAVGTTGACVGELACQQDWRHVAVWHLLAWALVALASVALSSLLKPRSYAP
ncbi:DUF1109 domain-containing protein [Corallococcus sp. M34]|uniref:DUF1109 domain-containing protein n=1 Tax=Citreicoccus inhibens TaxID=2849499 RepID=UPI001C214B91|nr:DUF1109 domain-containing protein [Citreicoccus inhibens]MBU8894508.1 DUF1109 domain-containing protein [Citreicoccus inhibens]